MNHSRVYGYGSEDWDGSSTLVSSLYSSLPTSVGTLSSLPSYPVVGGRASAAQLESQASGGAYHPSTRRQAASHQMVPVGSTIISQPSDSMVAAATPPSVETWLQNMSHVGAAVEGGDKSAQAPSEGDRWESASQFTSVSGIKPGQRPVMPQYGESESVGPKSGLLHRRRVPQQNNTVSIDPLWWPAINSKLMNQLAQQQQTLGIEE